jgi:hypothetical protein
MTSAPVQKTSIIVILKIGRVAYTDKQVKLVENLLVYAVTGFKLVQTLTRALNVGQPQK